MGTGRWQLGLFPLEGSSVQQQLCENLPQKSPFGWVSGLKKPTRARKQLSLLPVDQVNPSHTIVWHQLSGYGAERERVKQTQVAIINSNREDKPKPQNKHSGRPDALIQANKSIAWIC